MSNLTEIIRSKPNFYAEQGASNTQIEQAEHALGLKFATDYRECLQEYGAVSFDGHELTGLSVDKNLDVVLVTQRNWKKSGESRGLYVIEETHIDGIIVWQSFNGTIYETAPNLRLRKIASSLSEYIEK